MDDLPDDIRMEIIDNGQAGLPASELRRPAFWIHQNQARYQSLQEEYLQAGCTVLLAPTAGLTRQASAKWRFEDEIGQLTGEMVELTKKAAWGRARTAAVLGPLGRPPHGEEPPPFEELVDLYKEQVGNCLASGADLFIIEDVETLEEARSALLAVKESCSLPVWVLMPFDEEGKTAAGADVLSSLIILQDMGADGFGLSQNIGPEDMCRLLKKISPYRKIPLGARPEAFWKREEEEEIQRQMTCEEFGQWSEKLAHLGVGLIGGGRGAGPGHIREVAKRTLSFGVGPPVLDKDLDEMVVATLGAVHFLAPAFDFTHTLSCSAHMGEAIMDCEEEGASAIRILVESADDVEYLSENLYMIEMPLCIATYDVGLLHRIARIYSGTLLFDNTEEIPREQLEPLCKKYGMLVIGH